MAGKKDKAVVAVISGLTPTQAANIHKDIVKAKQKHAPNGRGTSSIGPMESIGNMLQRKQKFLKG